ncbi:carbohydrate deacetylase [Magnetococcus sp. PR-3]|uniref:carbohydrate deacetylase n=1 Tax=Magnetococcus sp. PR-3 TaxID=3120355 RepID=UPI002FCE0C79
MRYWIVHADDLGLQHCFNAGILHGYQHGLIRSTSIRTNGLAWDQAVEEVLPQCPDMGVGVHLCLNEGKATAKPTLLPTLCLPDGLFRHRQMMGFIRLALMPPSKRLKQEVECEFRAQIEQVLHQTAADHLNGHQHIHMIPWIFEITTKLAQEYKIPYVRWSHDPFVWQSLAVARINPLVWAHWLNMNRWFKRTKRMADQHGVKTNDVFHGLFHSSSMTMPVVERLVQAAPSSAVIELLLHPTIAHHQDTTWVDPSLPAYCNHTMRQQELETVCNPTLAPLLNNEHNQTTNFRQLASQHGLL